MTNRPKAIGTAAETAVVRFAQGNGYPGAERIVLHGALDEGDAQLCPGLVVEVKGGKAAEAASDRQVEEWLAEAAIERRNRKADLCPLVLKRKGKGAANAGQWWAYLPGWAFVYLAMSVHRVDVDAFGMALAHGELPAVRITLAELLDLTRRAGYGTPLP